MSAGKAKIRGRRTLIKLPSCLFKKLLGSRSSFNRDYFPMDYLLLYGVGGTLLLESFIDRTKRTIFSCAFSTEEPFTLFVVLLKHHNCCIVINLPERRSKGKSWVAFYVEYFVLLKKMKINSQTSYTSDILILCSLC